jgi:hypothetical protein
VPPGLRLRPATVGVRLGPAFAAVLFHALGVLLGVAMFVAAFPAGVLGSIGILFYRGLAVLLLVTAAHAVLMALLLRALRRGRRRRRVAPGPGHLVPVVVLAAALNLAFFVLVPVNLDRAISVFLLAWMDRHGAAATVPRPALEEAFAQIYIERYAAIDRRIAEQLASGNIVATPEGYRLTARGRAFVAFARFVGAIFSVDTRFLYPPADEAADPPPRAETR